MGTNDAKPAPLKGRQRSRFRLIGKRGRSSTDGAGRALFEQTLNLTDEVVIFLSPDRRVLEWNPMAERIFRCSRTTALGEDFFELIGTQFAPGERSQFASLLTGDVPTAQWERSYLRRHFAWKATRVGPSNGAFGILAIGRELTETRRLERRLLQIREREQARLAEALHEGLGQQLAALSFLTESLTRSLQQKHPSEAIRANEIRSLLCDALRQTRDLAQGLRPPELKRGGLIGALRALATQSQSLYGIACRFETRCENPLGSTHEAVGLHLYRIIQEAFRNAISRGRAKRIFINCEHVGHDLRLMVTDNGRSYRSRQRQGLELETIREHAELIGAKIEFTEGADTGCVLRCVLCLLSKA